MPEPSQPHAKLFKALLGHAGTAGVLIRDRLPPEVMVALLADDPPEPIDGVFVDDGRRGKWSDRRLKVRSNGSGP